VAAVDTGQGFLATEGYGTADPLQHSLSLSPQGLMCQPEDKKAEKWGQGSATKAVQKIFRGP